MVDVPAAINAWNSALGTSQVDDSAAARDRYGRSTDVQGTRPACILFPTSTEQVQSIVGIAAEHQVSLYPISRGKNWGYGDACAPMDGAAIVDLGRMNRIIEVNEELCYAVIEPGVTQGQLHAHLTTHHPNLWFDSTGAGLEASLVGNTLDRGFGHTRYGDHFATACGLEVVLADGQVLQTGFGHYPNAKATPVFRYGVGPFLDGLFCQSNFGIVTKMTLWLMPKPEAFTGFFLRMPEDAHLEPLIDRLRPLRLDGILTTALHIANDLRIISGAGTYPWHEAGGITPLPQTLREQLRHGRKIGAWNVAGAFTGSPGHVRTSCRQLKRALGPLTRYLNFTPEWRMQAATWAVDRLRPLGLAKRLDQLLVSMRPVQGLLKGFPSDDALTGARWRLRNPPSGAGGNPLDANAGLIWLSPVLPMTGSDARNVINIAEPIFEAHRFDPLITFTMINERAMVAILNVTFDKSVDEDCTSAAACYKEASEALIQAGYIPYRTAPTGMARLRMPGDAFWDTAAKIKAALDPSDLIAPGRYLPPITGESGDSKPGLT